MYTCWQQLGEPIHGKKENPWENFAEKNEKNSKKSGVKVEKQKTAP